MLSIAKAWQCLAKPSLKWWRKHHFFFNCKTNQSSLFSRIMNLKFWSNHKKNDNHRCFTACIHSYSLASAKKDTNSLWNICKKFYLCFLVLAQEKLMKFLNELSRNLAVVSSKSKIRVGSQIGSNMQIERREWKETLMKKWSLIPRFKVWKWNHISVALGNWISGRKKKHWAQPCLFFFLW